MVEHLAETIAPLVSSVTLVGAPERYSALNLRRVADLRTEAGPLAGLEAALTTTNEGWNLVLACDMPGLNKEIVQQLCLAASGTGKNAVVVRDSWGQVHPLCAIYRRECVGMVINALNSGRKRMLDFVDGLKPEFLDVSLVVRNVNTPEEWREAASLLPS
jgi:molybdopterin-guanine dinucleotide biosynthesis protein A